MNIKNVRKGRSLFKNKVFLSFLLLTMSVTATTAQFVHPGLTNKRSDLDRVKYMVEAQIDPWYASYQEMSADTKSSYNYTVRGKSSFTVLGRDDGTNYNAWNDDIRAAYYNAIMWYVTGDTRHAEKSIEIFNAWNNLQDVTSGGTQALSGAIIYIMLEAAEIIKSTYDGWSESDIQAFKDMLVYPGYSTTEEPAGISRTSGSFYWQAYQGDAVRHGNQGLAGFRAVMAMGIFMDNEIMYDRALRYIQGLPHRSDDLPYPPGPPQATTISSEGDYEDTYNFTVGTSIEDFGYNEVMTNYIYENGQCQESSRDQQHTVFGIGLLCAMAEMAWNQGDDLYSHVNDRLLLGLEYTTKYNVSFLKSYPDQTEWWIPTVASGEFTQRFNSSQRVFAKFVSPTHVGGFVEERPIFEMPLAHYQGRGFKTADEVLWTTRARDVAFEESGYEAAGHQNGAIGWGALTSRRPEGCYGEPISGFDSDGLPNYNMNILPMTIEAENFDYSPVSGQGRVYFDSTSDDSESEYRSDSVDIQVNSDGDYSIGNIVDGEWLTYTVYVSETNNYDILIRYSASNSDNKIKFSFGGSDKTDEVAVPSTGSLDTWDYITIKTDVNLTKGVQSLRIDFSGSTDSFNLDQFVVGRTNASDSNNFKLIKRNSKIFAIDGGADAVAGSSVELGADAIDEPNLVWTEISREGGYYSYQKFDTDLCWDGGTGGADGQDVTLEICDASDQDQQWEKIYVSSNYYRLQKQGTNFSIDGGAGGANGQNVYLWTSNSTDQNQHWEFDSTEVTAVVVPVLFSNDEVTKEDITLYPNPVVDMLNVSLTGSLYHQYIVYNIQGKPIMQGDIEIRQIGLELDFKSIRSGMYLIKLTGNLDSKILKVVKN